ncbi:MAG: CusA/CzcA family heavy metal efflux RND transporter [Chlorobi bacterium]|nr:CusA/CzcA family heavy metal efflux RND transporter [Chlorobiota bacterium]MBX7217043.1 CusA/CzcA family heavy metal efflux RND transporter [Candidatus Kapabacteria bacterium]
MFNAIIAFSLRHRALVLLAVLGLAAGGVYAFSRLPIDAVPDITNNQVQVLTSAPAFSPVEVERFITFPIETSLKSLPDLAELRSLSQSGLSVVTVVFHDDVDIYFARQQVLEKLREAEELIPDGVERPELAPVSTGLGEIFRYIVRDTTGKLSAMDLRTVQDYIVRRGLLGTPGLAEVNSLGGFVKQFHILVRPDALAAYGITLRQVFEAVARTSGNAGGAYIENGPEQYSVRSVGLATGIADLQSTVIRVSPGGTPLLLADVADVQPGAAIRFGSASQDGKGEVVTGITMQLKGANSRVTVNAVKQRIEELRGALPPGVVIEPYYDREELVDRTITTVITNLMEGALLVVGVLLLFLVNLRAGIVLASVIPLSMLFAGIMMVLTGQSGNLMSLGAIDFGLVVDGSLIIVENCLRMLESRYRQSGGVPLTDVEMRRLLYAGSVEVRKAAQFGEIIIIVVYLPILTLQGIEGKLFRPMALTVAYALVGALLMSVTYVPAMLSLVLKKQGRVRHSPIITTLQRWYAPLLRRSLGMRWVIVPTTVLLLAGAIFTFTRLGGEFIPRLDEGDIAMHIIRIPSVSLTESQQITNRVEAILKKFPEVRTVVSSTGRAEISTDPMGVELADAYVMLHPREEWNTGRTKAELVEAMDQALKNVPGAGVQFLQPIEMRMNELIAGARGDVVVKITGEEFQTLNPAAESVARILRGTPGAADVTLEQTSGLPQLVIRPNRAAIARYGMTVEEVNDVIRTAIGGMKAAEVAEGEKRFDVVVRLAEPARNNAEAIGNIWVSTPSGPRVPLSELASVALEEGPTRVLRQDGSRFVMVQANVRGRDVESFVNEVRAKITAELKLPAGYNITFGGQFENLQAASQRLTIVVPIALALIFGLLFQTFRSARIGVMIFLCVPMAIIGGIGGLVIAGLPFSISAGVGFIALFGIAVLNGIVMVAAIRKFQTEGFPRREAVLAGAEERLRPVVTTAALAAFGFVPMLLASGAGAEVQRPLATVIIGGLVSSTFLTLFILPIIYDWLGSSQPPSDHVLDVTGPLPTPSPTPSPVPHGAGNTAVVLLMVAIGCVAAAQRAESQTPLTMEEAQRRAVAASPLLRRGDAVIQRERGQLSGASLLPDPEVFYTVDESAAPGLVGKGNSAVGVSQTLDFPTLAGARSGVANARLEQATWERKADERAVQRRAALAWYDAYAARTAAQLADSATGVAREFARLTEAKRNAGEIGALEAAQAQLALATTQRRQRVAEGRYQQALTELRLVIGASPAEPVQLPNVLPAGAAVPTFDQLEAALRANAPQLQAAKYATQAANAERKAVAMQGYPSLTLEYSLQTVDAVGGYYGGGVRLGVPLWRWMNSGPGDAAAAEEAIRQAEASAIEREMLAELRLTWEQYQTAQRTADEYQQGVLPQASKAYQIALQLYQQGEATYLEALTAQAAFVELRADAAEAAALAERLRLGLQLLTGSGGGK